MTDHDPLEGARYVELQTTTHLSFLRGASSPEELFSAAALLVYPTDREAYSRLCRLLSVGKGRAGKGACHIHWSDVGDWCEGLISALVPDRVDADTEQALARSAKVFGDQLTTAVS